MTDQEFLPKLRAAFAIEAKEHLEAMTSGLLELERAVEAPQQKVLIETIFREVHSLKGASGAVSRTDLQTVCQAMEDVFSAWKRQPVRIAAESFDTLSQVIDLITKLLRLPDVATDAAEQEDISRMTRQVSELLNFPSPAIESSAMPIPSVRKPSDPKALAQPSGRTPTVEPTIAVPPPITPSPEPVWTEAEGPQLSETVRIRMVKMDSLLRKAEEMVAVKLTASQHLKELRGLGDTLAEWRKEWGKVRDLMRTGLTCQNEATLTKLGEFLEWNQSHMRVLEKRLTTLADIAARDEHDIGKLVDDLLDDAKRLVMLPFSTVLDLLPKLLRDLARSMGKEADLVLLGREVEIDKRILQEIKDPLIHLVRNSIDHGLEKPAARLAANKPSCGTIRVVIFQRDAGKVEIVVSDDGTGISRQEVIAAAIRYGTLAVEDAAQLDEPAALALIFNSGVSTSSIITEISGRGLGMAIVREKVEKLGGTITIESLPGIGTSFRIVLPITLATFKGILVSAGGQSFVIPTANVWRIKRIRQCDIQTVENRDTMVLDGRAIAFVRLDEALELTPLAAAEQDGFIEVVVLGAAEKRIGFAVDEVLFEQEVLVKNLGTPLLRVRNVAGATILGSGVPALILNASDLLKTAVRLTSTGHRRSTETPQAAVEAHKLSILVTDDSVTSRMLLKNILESSGYRVVTAIDGMDALTLLKTRDFDLVVSDVEMPRMDGFELTAKIRADKKLSEMPVVLVTALSSREHQERGIDVGANAYIVKGSFDQSNLLQVIQKLI